MTQLQVHVKVHDGYCCCNGYPIASLVHGTSRWPTNCLGLKSRVCFKNNNIPCEPDFSLAVGVYIWTADGSDRENGKLCT